MKELSPSESLLVLNLIPGLGSVRIRALLECFGSAEMVLAAPQQLLERVPRMGPKLAAAVASWQQCTDWQRECACAADCGVRIVTLLDEDYPPVLRRMADPPVVLYVRGEWRSDDDERAVSIVGSRQATPYGMTQARRFGRELADAGSCIISGLARGIDTAAHWGALDAGGSTIAVLGNGLSRIFPPENAELADHIINGHGALVSEFPMNMAPSRTSFPQRNRIVAAWSRATLVVEAPQRSGALHTARLAGEYGRSVFAVPGPADSVTSAGCHDLIRDGAILCCRASELAADMNWVVRPASGPGSASRAASPRASASRAVASREGVSRGLQTPSRRLAGQTTETGPVQPCLIAPGDEGREILEAVRAGHETLDQLCAALGQPASALTPLLMQLVIARRLMPQPGGRYVAVG